MKKFKTLYYLTEQDEELSPIYKKMEAWKDEFNKLSDEEKTKLAEDPNGYGKDFWEKLDTFVKEINTSITNPDTVLENEDAIIKGFQSELEKFPEMYDGVFKSTFDRISPTAAIPSVSSDKTAPSTEEMPSTKEDAKEEVPSVGTPKEEYSKDYSGASIVDFLDQSGKPSDIESRRKLAVELGIVNRAEDYEGTAEQNTRLLNALKSGKVTSDDGVEVRKGELAKPYTKPKEGKAPTIKYGRMEYPAYVDMGGGKYRPAYQEELDNPNIQLYIPNPKKGTQEYNKPNFVKVRREGSDIRPQSQFGGALGSVSNLFGDIGRTLTGK
jgi:hypothetical protein